MKKKFLLLATLSLFVILSAVVLSACYVSNPATLDNVVGTYELDTYTRTPKADGETTYDSINMIEKYGIKAYLVLKENGRGYYVYKDNETPLYAKEIIVTYKYDSDELVESIYYNAGVSDKGDGYPGKGEEDLGVNFKKKRKRLAYNFPAIKIGAIDRQFSQTVHYEKVSDKTDLSYVKGKLGNVSVAPYEVQNLTGVHVFDGTYSDDKEYLYYIIDMNVTDKKATVYSKKKGEEGVVNANVEVNYVIPKSADAGENIKITVGDKSYEAAYGINYAPTSIYERELNEDGSEKWSVCFGTYAKGTDIQGLIAGIEEAYENYLAEKARQEEINAQFNIE